MSNKQLPWFKKKLPRSFSRGPLSLELSNAQYSTIESAGEMKLGATERRRLLELLRRYQRERLTWSSAPRRREVREIIEDLEGDSEKLRKRMRFLLSGKESAKESALNQLLLNVLAPEPTTPRWYGWEYRGNDWQTWLENTLSRVSLLESWSRLTARRLRGNDTGGRDGSEILRGLIRSLREFFLQNHGRDEHRFGRDRLSSFICFVEATLSCVPDHPEVKALAKMISRALDEDARAGQNPRRKS